MIAQCDPGGARSLPGPVAIWERRADEEERRARGGALLSAARVVAFGASVPSTAALDDALRPGGVARPVWLRAAAAAAAIDDPATAELVSALLLCAVGATDALRLLPFATVEPSTRTEAIAAWRANDVEPWAHAALGAAAQSARALRLGIAGFVEQLNPDNARLDSLGRAAITARRALAFLRDGLATNVPTLAERLGCSRPAASDALDRLTELGLATEITGRGRDRVFALTSALALVALPHEFSVGSA